MKERNEGKKERKKLRNGQKQKDPKKERNEK